MRRDAVKMAMTDFQKAIKELNDPTMRITLNGNNAPFDVGSEAEVEVPLDGNVLIIKDQNVLCYVDCDIIDIIEIW